MMNETAFLALIHNVSLLMALVLLFNIVKYRLPASKLSLDQVPQGLLIGGIGIGVMLSPWVMAPGIVFDTRSVLLAVSGLFFGLIPTTIAVLMTAAYRIHQGGAATIMGVAVIISSGLIGILWRHILKEKILQASWLQLYGFGIIVHLTMLGCACLLPWPTAAKILSNISLPVMIIYPLGTSFLGLMMVNNFRREQTTDKLAISEEQLRLAVESGNIGLFDRNFETQKVKVSAEWKQQLGYKNDEFPDDSVEWEKRLHPDDKSKAIDAMEECIHSDHDTYEVDFRMQHKDGSYRWILEKGLIHRNSSGKAVRLIGSHVDITRQKENIEDLQKSESRFRGLAESSQDYIMLYDQECRHVYMNSAGLRVSGLTEKDIFGKTHREAGFSEEMCHLWESDIEKVFQTGESTQMLFDWESVQGKVYLDLRLSPVKDIDGNVDMVLGISRDISTIKNAEDELHNSHEQYRLLTESIKDVVWVLDLDSMKFRYVSPSVEMLRGFTVAEVMAQPFSEVFTNESQEALEKLIRERFIAFNHGDFASDKYFTDEVPQPRKDGSVVWTEAITNFYRNEESGHIEVRGVSRDISDRKRVEEVMASTQYELKRMLREADQSRRALLSVAEDQKLTDDALRKTAEELVVAYDATLQGWSSALEMRERETAGHSLRVVQRTLELANALGIDQQEMIHIQRGALLHDIGKMGIPDSILLKPGPLTDDEWVIMRQHPSYAHKLLSNIPYLTPALEIPFFHHERWDGSGYPQGLTGENIPLKARIFAVVDVWDALSSDRPYRPAWAEDAVNKYLRDQAGKQFDPKVVEIFLRLFSK
jgi:PAS domain S-box-containing protein